MDDYETHVLLEKSRSSQKHRRDDNDDERHWFKRARKEFKVAEGGEKVAEEDPYVNEEVVEEDAEEMATEDPYATEEGCEDVVSPALSESD